MVFKNIPARIRMCGLLLIAGGLFVAKEAGSETMKMITYYPAPYGSYKKFMTSGLTVLSRNQQARTGIGTVNPAVKLDVAGIVRIGSVAGNPDDCVGAKSGALRWNNGSARLQYCDGTAWRDFGSDAGNQQFINNYIQNVYKGRTLVYAYDGDCNVSGAVIVERYWDGASGGGSCSCSVPGMWASGAPSCTGQSSSGVTSCYCWGSGCGFTWIGSHYECSTSYPACTVAASSYSRTRCIIQK